MERREGSRISTVGRGVCVLVSASEDGFNGAVTRQDPPKHLRVGVLAGSTNQTTPLLESNHL